MQLEIYHDPKLKIKRTDRIFFNLMMDWLSTWQERMFIVKPDTVIKWHRTAFKFYWRWKSQHKEGRPRVSREVIALIKQMANENSEWGAPRIHGELLKLGIEISQFTVQRYFPKRGGRTLGQRWKTFLKNHSREIISIDFLTVPALNFKLIHILVVIEHHTRKIIYFNVSKFPNPERTLQQIRNMLFDHEPPKYLIRDRDTKYGIYCILFKAKKPQICVYKRNLRFLLSLRRVRDSTQV